MNKTAPTLAAAAIGLLFGATLFAAVNASGLVRRIDFSQQQSPAGELQYIFSVQVTQVHFGNYGGTCKFYVELKDGNGKHYFGAAKVHQGNFSSSAGYAVTYVFPVDIGGLDRPSYVAYAAELEVDNAFINSYKQNVGDLEQWKMQGASYDKVRFGRLSYVNH